MGRPIAHNLVKGGHRLFVSDVSRAASQALLDLGAEAEASNKEIASGTDVIFLSLPNAAIVQSVLLGNEGVFQNANKGLKVIDLSSIAPQTTRYLAKEAEKYSVKYIDAPVSGGVSGAEKGTLTIMVGTDDETFGQIEELLQTIGKKIFHVGAVGSGHAIKMVNNLLLGCNMAALAEAIALGLDNGLTLETMRDIISVSSGELRHDG